MGLISRTADLFYTFRFLKLLVTPWEKMDAFTLGIIDKDGNVLRRSSTLTTDAERSAYTPFHRLVFNIKKLLNKVPLGKTRIASYAAALYLIKEQTGMSDKAIRRVFESIENVSLDLTITENTWMLNERGQLQPGSYRLRNDVPMLETFEFRAFAGTAVVASQPTTPAGLIIGVPVFVVNHRNTNQKVLVSLEDITR